MSTGSPTHSFLAGVTADLLAQGERLDRLSRLLSFGALAGLIGCALIRGTGPVLPTGLALSLACGAAQAYFAVRVGLDAALFTRLASSRDGAGGEAVLDQAMLELGLVAADRTGRPLALRAAGARRLLARQALALVAQIAVAPGAALLALSLP